MTLVSLPILALVFTVGLASFAFAAGGGGSAGGAGAQNQPASGLPLGEAGPVGSPNNPRKVAEPDHSEAAPISGHGEAVPEIKGK